MSLFRSAPGCALLLILASGCRSASTQSSSVANERSPKSVATFACRDLDPAARPADSTIRPCSHDEPVRGNEESIPPEEHDPFIGQAELPLDAFLAAVEQRNPSLAGLVAAWQAAAQRYPQVVALDDPTFQFMMAPASLGSSEVEPAYAIQASQKLPWFGKRAARGQAATDDANAAYFDAEDGRLRLREAATFAFVDYYLVQRNLESNAQDVRVMRELRATAQTKYQANQATQQDVLQAEVELADLDRRQIELDRTERVAVARIDTLLRRRPNAPLPAAPRRLPATDAVPAAEQLESVALGARPDLAALRARIEAQQAAVTLACKQADPDVEVFGRYDTFWQPSSMAELRGQVGFSLNLPIYRGKLNAAVNEALCRLNQRKSEYEERVLEIQYEVRSAYERVEESRKTLQLYRERILPAVEQNVAAARANYHVGKTTFPGMAQAQRQLIELREKQEEAIAESHRRLAELERVIGGPLPTPAPTGS